MGYVKHDWDKIVPLVQELVGESTSLESLRHAINARVSHAISGGTFREGLKRELKNRLNVTYRGFNELRDALSGPETSPLERGLLSVLQRKGKGEPLSLITLSEEFDRAPSRILSAAENLRETGRHVVITDDRTAVSMPKTLAPTEWEIPIEEYRSGLKYRFGVIGDTHLGNRYARLDVLDALYDIFEKEGVNVVLHAGNLPAGESNLNRHELIVTGVEGQLQYIVKNYPKRTGITTKFITADCHEGWWAKAGWDVGRYMEMTFHDRGRGDLEWIGHVEADLSLDQNNPRAILRVAHPGGGTSYALSYTFQKWVESLQGGAKPNVALLGHFHKYVVGYPRNVMVVEMGCICDQTIWMRKKRLEAHVGGVLVDIDMTPAGTIASFRHEFFPFFDHGFYKTWDYRSFWESHSITQDL